jgi:hypothetical protein
LAEIARRCGQIDLNASRSRRQPFGNGLALSKFSLRRIPKKLPNVFAKTSPNILSARNVSRATSLDIFESLAPTSAFAQKAPSEMHFSS